MIQNLNDVTNKKICNRFLILALISLVITIILGIIFILSFNYDFCISNTVWGNMTSSIDSSNPGAGEYLLLSGFISGVAFLGEIGFLIVIGLVYFFIPICVSMICLVINILARLFQIGEIRSWKNTTTKILLYISTVLQGIFCIYLLVLSLTGFGLIYILLYLALFINIYFLIKEISNLKYINSKMNN